MFCSFLPGRDNFVSIAEDDVKQPSSPSVKKTEEKGIIVVHEVKCKLYVKVIFVQAFL